MTTVFDGIRDYAQQHTVSVSAVFVVIVTGTYFYSIGGSLLLDFAHPGLSEDHSSTLDVKSTVSLKLAVSAPALAQRRLVRIENTRIYIKNVGIEFDERIEIDWILHFSFDRVLSVAITAAVPAIFVLSVRQFPKSWASRHHIAIANVLHAIVLARFADHRFEAPDLLVAVLVMVAFDVFQHALDREAADATDDGESEQQPQAPSTLETLMDQTHFVLAKSEFTHHPENAIDHPGGLGSVLALQSGVSDTKTSAIDSRAEEIVRLHRNINELRIANKAKEALLLSVKEELCNAREALNETIADYSNLREELKIVKQTLGRDHQAIVYRKDIELFALRKGNDQKEKYIKEHDAKLDDIHRQQKATIEAKDRQLESLKNQLTFMDRQANPQFGQDDRSQEGGDHALEVRLLRVKKGRNSLAPDQEKDAIIAKLREDLAVANKAAEAIVNQQAELQRAWDIAKKIQSALIEEKEHHAQTREQLQEATVMLSEKEWQTNNRSNSNGRLPTIDEDDSDTKELEAMFDTAQEDNLRLYTEIETLEKRLRDANARMFVAERDAETLREQVRLEKAINDDLESARRSGVHRDHFQHVEDQLRESQDAILAKDEEIELLKNTVVEKDHYVNDLQREVNAAMDFHTQDQDHIERLQHANSELYATKEQLMLDHERLASQRTRQRVVSGDRTSERSSGATLIQELSPQLPRHSDEHASVEVLPPMPSLAESKSDESIQVTPKRHLRSTSTPNGWSLISTDVPPPELREPNPSRTNSIGFRDLMKRIVRKDEKLSEAKSSRDEKVTENGISRLRSAIVPRDRNALIRPKSAACTVATIEPVNPNVIHMPTVASTPHNARPLKSRNSTPQWYAAQEAKGDERPKTNAGDEAVKPFSRRSWAAK